MVVQVADPHPHVVQRGVGKSRSHGQTQQGMNHPQRKNTAVAAKHFAEEQPSQQGRPHQDRAGDVRGGEQDCRSQDGRSATQGGFQPHIEERLQNELLHNSPDRVLPQAVGMRPMDGSSLVSEQ